MTDQSYCINSINEIKLIYKIFYSVGLSGNVTFSNIIKLEDAAFLRIWFLILDPDDPY